MKDSAIPLCDEHFPDKNSKSGWIVAFYNKDSPNLNAVLNRVATDLGNEPPQKSKSIKTQKKKQRQRIKDLAEKYEFDPFIPKKGLEDKGKDALLKVGAVCCDCGKDYEVCKTQGTGVSILQPGKDEIVMPDAADLNSLKAEDIVTFVMGELGFMAGYESRGQTGADAGVGEKTDAWSETLAELQKSKKKAVEDEDFERAQELKSAIEKLQNDAAKKLADVASNKLKELKDQKAKAIDDENYKRAKELKLEIESIEKATAQVEL